MLKNKLLNNQLKELRTETFPILCKSKHPETVKQNVHCQAGQNPGEDLDNI